MAYRTLEEIQLRKDQLREAIDRESRDISTTWSSLSARRESSTRGEYVANLVSYGVTAFDALMTMRKLKRNYGGIMGLLGRSGKGKKR
ncbi:MAG: hypothetical protein IJV45_02910 [Prevotella sp.]|nr:hypothetical protein [Prevotella sp.]